MRRRVERDPGLLSSFLTTSEFDRGASAPAPEDAARMFAAKEAVVKALGAQGDDGILFREIELSVGKGPHVARLSGRALEIAAERGAGRIHLSWTCKEMKAMAVAVVESDVTSKEIA
jgi:phosphopantetheinyl transferase (holo-ACP synthase)